MSCCGCGFLGHLAPVHRCARSVCCGTCAVSWATWLLFTGVPAWCVVLPVRCPGPLGSCSPVCPLAVLCCLCGVPGNLALVHRCARSVCCVVCAVSRPTWLLFTGMPARCVVLCGQCAVPLGSCSPLCPLGALLWMCGVLGHLAPDHRCAHSVRCFACACPGPLGSCSPVCPLGVLCCVCGALGHLARLHRCARSVCCFAGAVSWATWLLFTGVPAPCATLLVRVLGHFAPDHRCAGSVCCFAGAVSWATWLLFTGVPAPCVALRVRCPRPLGSCSPVCPPSVLCCVCCVPGHLAPVHRCARSVGCFACAMSWATWLLVTGVAAWCVVLCVRCPVPLGSSSPVCPSLRYFAGAVSWATWLLFTGVPARCVALLVRCPGPLGSCPPLCPLGVLCCVCGVLGHLAPVHWCARSVRCFACAVSWPTWLLFTGVPARCVALRVRCPGPLGSCSPECPLGVLCGVCGVLGHLAPVHRCACSVCCVVCAVSRATWLLLTGVPA